MILRRNANPRAEGVDRQQIMTRNWREFRLNDIARKKKRMNFCVTGGPATKKGLTANDRKSFTGSKPDQDSLTHNGAIPWGGQEQLRA